MAWSPNISKYWVWCLDGAAALALSKVYIMLTPSIGFCEMPSTTVGARMPVASKMVGTMSITWWNWKRMPPLSVMRAGQEIAIPCFVPPKCDAICLVQENGVSNAHDHGTAMWLYVLSEPQV